MLDPDNLPDPMTTGEVAELARVSEATVRRAIDDGTLPGHRPEGRRKWTVRREDAVRWALGEEGVSP